MVLNRCLVALLCVHLLATAVWGAPIPAPSDKDRCAVCGMFVSPFPAWVAAIQFRDGSSQFFDGPKDMFVYFFNLNSYHPQASPEEITGIFVTEYYSTRPVPAKEVYFVVGSDVRGPMGDEMVPVQGRDNVETFVRDHGGTKIMQFDGTNFIELPAAR